MEIPYKSFCWSFGTTSFRTKDFNKTIEEQLLLLNDFFSLPDNHGVDWIGNNKLQTRYYDFMQDMGFVEGNARNKPKDAREKTSGLVDIGLIDNNRRLTNAGLELLRISCEGDYLSDNEFHIAKDSYIYFKQLLKTYYEIEERPVRPFLVLLYLLGTFEFLTIEESTYLLPLCTGPDALLQIVMGIMNLREGRTTVDDIIIERLFGKPGRLGLPNYTVALEYLLENDVTEELICTIGFNRKSRTFDKSYFNLYNALYDFYINHNNDSLISIYSVTFDIKIGIWWRNYLFDTSSGFKIRRDPLSHLRYTLFDQATDEINFKSIFFKLMHLFKSKATLSDYFDLNRRYVKTTDVVLFEDGLVKLDIIPKCFFKPLRDQLYTQLFLSSELLPENCELINIADFFVFDEDLIIDGINEELGLSIYTLEEAQIALEDNRYNRLQHLIDTKFTDEKLIRLLECFENRSDVEIRCMVTDNADVPTIFEYVLGIIWYKISYRQGKILEYMKLSLDADLLPKTHAAGGEADIVYEYRASTYCPAHTLLLEATLADSTNQRRMEMEPVSRHLGRHLIRTGALNSYCVFVTPYLDINVIADFRGRKNMPFYDTVDVTNYIEGMKIIPLRTAELKTMIQKHVRYNELYSLFDDAFYSILRPHEWYERMIKEKL